MNTPFTFEIEEFEMPESAETEQSCHRTKSQAKRRDELEEDEDWEALEFEEEFPEEVPLLRKGAPIVAAKAQQVAAAAKQQAAAKRAGLTAEKTARSGGGAAFPQAG